MTPAEELRCLARDLGEEGGLIRVIWTQQQESLLSRIESIASEIDLLRRNPRDAPGEWRSNG